MDFFPDVEKLAEIFAHAAAPAFFLGAVAGFVSLMSARLSTILERIASAQSRKDADPGFDEADRDLEQLAHRAQLLGEGVLLSLCSGICATLLLFIIFVSQFAGFHHAYGAAALFVLASLLLGLALLRFAQEAMSTQRIGRARIIGVDLQHRAEILSSTRPAYCSR